MKIEHIKFFLGLGLFLFLLVVGVAAVFTTIQNDSKRAELRAALPMMERVGEYQLDNQSLYLYGFDFEGKRCLWMTRLKHAGLTCWDVK